MKKKQVLKTMSAVYAVIGAFTLCMSGDDIGISIFAVLSFMGAYVASDAVETIEYEERMELSLYEGTGND